MPRTYVRKSPEERESFLKTKLARFEARKAVLLAKAGILAERIEAITSKQQRLLNKLEAPKSELA